MSKSSFKTIFLSDIHLFSKACKAEELLEFLNETSSESIFLVGDIIDFWSLKRNFFLPESHLKILSLILKRSRNGVRVIYIPGNHDEECRNLVDHTIGSIEIHYDYEYVSEISGRTYKIIHGDEADKYIQHALWLAKIGSYLYDQVVSLNSFVNKIRSFFNLPYYSVSGRLKRMVKLSNDYMSSFMNEIVRLVDPEKFDGVVCGHIHQAQIKSIKSSNGRFIEYINCGDWCESCTAIVEDFNGSFNIIKRG